MISDGKPFDTNVFFSGGAGMFIQYHDVVKPVYLYAIIKMISMGESFGLPISIIENMSTLSIIEWYMNRRYKNPFKCLDYNHYLDDDQLDSMMWEYLLHDTSLYKLSPVLNIGEMMHVYRKQHMQFPIYVYSEHEEPYIKEDIKEIFNGIRTVYLFGDLKECIKKCEQNFTYIFSDIELLKQAADILMGTYSHILLAQDYRYNYTDYFNNLKYDLKDIQMQHPYLRIGTTEVTNIIQLVKSFLNKTREEN